MGSLDFEDPGIEAQVAAVSARLSDHLAELTADIRGVIDAAIPALRGDEAVATLLHASVQENVNTMLYILGHGTDVAQVDAPTAAVEYARRLAQRDVPSVALIRAYRVGQTQFIRRCIEDLLRHGEGSHLEGATSLRMVEQISKYIDHVVEQILGSYDRAREEWLQYRSEVLAIGVRSVLEDDGIMVDTAESRLGHYRIRQYHVGLDMWADSPIADDAPLTVLRRLADALADTAGCRDRALFVPRDESNAWVWLPLAGRTSVDRDPLEKVIATSHPAVSAALGEPAKSLEGFRRTHQQALSARSVALTAIPRRSRLTPFAEVAPVAMMCNDIAATRDWIRETLGELATDSERHARLRDTARVFLASGGSYTATAEQLILHRNTAQYRVRKAEEVRGRPLRDGRLDVELALLGCHWLGRAVLSAPSGTNAQSRESRR